MTRHELIDEIGELADRAETTGHLAAAGILAALGSCLASGNERTLLEVAVKVSEAGVQALQQHIEQVN